MSIFGGDIVWVNGPFPCGHWPDIEIFRQGLKHVLEERERVEADDGYRGEDPLNVKVPASMCHPQEEQILLQRTVVRRRHETMNNRLKQFKILDGCFRHDIKHHGMCFHAVVVLTQLSIENGHPLFEIDDYY
jgi:hypothetical protein